MVPGDVFDGHFADKAVGAVDMISGALDRVKYFFWGMKEPDYVMKMMATGGVFFSEGCKFVRRKWGNGESASFSYTKPFDWHFCYRHVVDDHNNLHHSLPSIEDTWRMERWPVRVFSFILAITEVNIYLTKKFFTWDPEKVPTYLKFRRDFAWDLIDNPVLEVEEDKRRTALVGLCDEHKLIKAPPHARSYARRRWKCDAKIPYQQYKCRGVEGQKCKKKIRTSCSCNPGHWMCAGCHVIHFSLCREEVE